LKPVDTVAKWSQDIGILRYRGLVRFSTVKANKLGLTRMELATCSEQSR